MADIKRVIRATVDLNEPIQKTIMRDLFVTESKNAHELRIKLMRGEAPVPLDDVIVSGFFMRYRDNVSCILSGSVQDDEVVVALTPECYEQRTVFSVTIAVENTDTRTPVFVGEGQMVANRSDTVYDPDGYVPSLQDILSQYELMKSINAEANTAALAANTAALAANTASVRAEAAANSIDGMMVDALISTDQDVDVEITTINGAKHILFTIPAGSPGKSFKILGTYDSLLALQEAVPYPNQGDVYNVGTEAPYAMYMWDTTGGTEHWLYLGELESGLGTVQSVDGILADEDGNVAVNAVRYDGQTLNENQKAVARNNINVYSKNEVENQLYWVRAVSSQVVIPTDSWRGEDPFFYDAATMLGNDYTCIFVNPIPSQIQEYANCGIYLSSRNGAVCRFVASKKPSSTMYIDLVGLHA